MGAGRLVVGLAWRNVRHRPWQALLLLLALSVATTTITLAMALVDVSGRLGPGLASHTRLPRRRGGRSRRTCRCPARAGAAELGPPRRRAGVIAVGGPWRQAQVDAEIDGGALRLRVQVRDTGPAAVDQPLVTAGHWLDDREGVVLEDGFATAAGLQPGDTITIAGQRAGTWRGVDGRRGPVSDGSAGPGVGQPGHRRPARHGPRRGRVFARLRLADPDQAESFAAAHPEVSDTWQETRSETATDIEDLAAVFGVLAIFVVVLTIGTAVILVAGRMAAQIRQVGTLKAVGVTPGQVTCVLLVEYLAVAVLATAVGLAAGNLLAPPLARVTDVLAVYGARPTDHVATRATFAVTTAVVVLATVRGAAAVRGAAPCAPSPATPATPPARPADGRSPGCRSLCRYGWAARANRRRGRFLANTLGLTVGITLLITALALRTGVDSANRVCPSTSQRSPRRRHRDPGPRERPRVHRRGLPHRPRPDQRHRRRRVRRPRPRPQPRHHAHDRHRARPSRPSSSPS